MEDKHRIAIVNAELCKPNKCHQECRTSCPVNKTGKECISVKRTDKIATISELLCVGCNRCVSVCPFGAVKIINIPIPLTDIVHRYGNNMFVLYKLPIPKINHVIGLVGANGTGKSTAIKILAGTINPNFGNYKNPSNAMDKFKGTELQTFFNTKKRTCIKIQHVDQLYNITQFKQGTIEEHLKKFDIHTSNIIIPFFKINLI